jgi:hypothetical protein
VLAQTTQHGEKVKVQAPDTIVYITLAFFQTGVSTNVVCYRVVEFLVQQLERHSVLQTQAYHEGCWAPLM